MYRRKLGKGPSVARYDVAKLRQESRDENDRETPRSLFQQLVGEKLQVTQQAERTEGRSVEGQWTVLKEALCESAEAALGVEKKRHPDWFRECSVTLQPLIEERNRLYTRWLQTSRESDRRAFVKKRSDARRAIRDAKNTWFQSKAAEAQRGRHGGKLVWECIRDIQHGRRGLVPVRSMAVKDEEGCLCHTPEEQQERWRRHFTSILNVQSLFDMEELKKARQRPLRPSMADSPSKEELEKAIHSMKNGKMGGTSGILPEMVKAVSYEEDFMDALLTLVHRVWRESRVPQDWTDAILVPIPKKGDLTRCENWRGIALLDVVGKVVVKLLQ